MTPEKRELLRLCDEALKYADAGVFFGREKTVQLARALKELLTRPEAQGETPMGMIPDALERADKAVRVLSTILKNAKLMDGFAVADEVLADIICARKEVAHIRELSAKREGFVTVPREPTQEMIDAAESAYVSQPKPMLPWADVYRTMIAAATKETRA